jgi:hypothetical protein
VREARQRAGLQELGDSRFEAGLAAIARSADEDGFLHRRGRTALRETLIASVVARLRLVDELARAPAALEEAPRRPLMIAGLPRTGTTLLHRLLCLDPGALYLPLWLGLDPYPPPDDAEFGATDGLSDRRQRARAIVDGLREHDPELAAIHAIDADGPEECSQLFRSTLESWQYFITTPLPSYLRWYVERDPRPAYGEFRSALQLLQSTRSGGHWVLKAPQHWGCLGALLDVFPDADVVCTHRDPSQVVGSWCSLLSHLWGAMSDDVDPHALGKLQLGLLARATEHAVDAHARAGDRIVDVCFRSLVADPLQTVRALYQRTGRELTPDTEARMAAWLDDNPRGKHGAHRYTLAEFGLTDADTASAFAGYRDGLLARVEAQSS